MSATLLKILNMVIPAVIGGFFSFLVTSYSYKKNTPTDKMEIAYNRVYYPISKLIKEGGRQKVEDEAGFYLDKYDKYADRTTVRIYKELKKSPESEKDAEYKRLVVNINSRCENLRRRLGYLDASFPRLWIEAPKPLKSTMRLLIYVCVIYILASIMEFTGEKTDETLSALVFIVGMVFVGELIYKIIFFFIRKIRARRIRKKQQPHEKTSKE